MIFIFTIDWKKKRLVKPFKVLRGVEVCVCGRGRGRLLKWLTVEHFLNSSPCASLLYMFSQNSLFYFFHNFSKKNWISLSRNFKLNSKIFCVQLNPRSLFKKTENSQKVWVSLVSTVWVRSCTIPSKTYRINRKIENTVRSLNTCRQKGIQLVHLHRGHFSAWGVGGGRIKLDEKKKFLYYYYETHFK